MTSSRVVLDTHAWIAHAAEPNRLSRVARGAIQRSDARGGLVIADVTLWEAAHRARAGRIRLDEPLRMWLAAALERTKVRVEAITPEIAALAVDLGFVHADPADRLIVATAKALGVPLVTSDGKIQDSGLVETIW